LSEKLKGEFKKSDSAISKKRCGKERNDNVPIVKIKQKCSNMVGEMWNERDVARIMTSN
jgi:hypothetical protein